MNGKYKKVSDAVIKWLPVFYVAFLFFFLEIILFSGLRFATYYFRAQLVIAFGLLSLAFGGILAAYVSDKYIYKAKALGFLSLVFAPWLGLGGILAAPINFWASALLLSLAFLPSGFLIGLFYRIFDSARTYAVELWGGATGLILSLLLLPLLREENSLIFLFLTSAVVFGFLYREHFVTASKKVGVIVLLEIAVILLGSNLFFDYLNLAEIVPCRWPETRTFPKVTCQKDVFPGYRVVRSYGSVVDRIDILDLGHGMLHTSFAGDATDSIKPYPPLPHYRIDARLPYGIVESPKTLILGAAAEGVVKVVKAVGAEDIVAVDLNSAIVNLWKNDRGVRDFGVDPFEGVELINADGRAFLEGSDEDFDIITMMNTHRSRDAEAFGEPDFLHTKEAFRLFWDHLTQRGLLSFEEKNINQVAQQSIERNASTLIAVLRDFGVDRPEEHVVAYEWIGAWAGPRPPWLSNNNFYIPGRRPIAYVQFLVKKSPWTESEINHLLQWSEEASRTDNLVMPTNMIFHRWLWLPFNPQKISSEAAYLLPALLGSGAGADNLILTDNAPFSIMLSEIVSRDFLYSLLLFGLIFIGAIAWWYTKSRRRINRESYKARRDLLGMRQAQFILPFFFIIIGLGYMAIEIALIQWFQLLLGSVILGLIISIGGLLSASAASSWMLRKRRVPFMVFAATPLVIFMLLWFFSAVMPLFFVNSLLTRALFAFILAVLMGAGLGLYFPRAAHIAGKLFPGDQPILVGLNGSAMALGVPLSFFAASQWGIFSLATFSSVLYLAAALLLLKFLTVKHDE